MSMVRKKDELEGISQVIFSGMKNVVFICDWSSYLIWIMSYSVSFYVTALNSLKILKYI